MDPAFEAKREALERTIQAKLREYESHDNSVIAGQTGETGSSVQNARASLIAHQQRGVQLAVEVQKLRAELHALLDGDGEGDVGAEGEAAPAADLGVELVEGDDELVGTTETLQPNEEQECDAEDPEEDQDWDLE
jgi:hypothetical protein